MSLTHDTTDARLRFPVSAHEPDIEKVLISTEEIESALATMGEQITKDYAKSLLLVGVLQGRVRRDGRPRAPHRVAARVRLHGGVLVRGRDEDQWRRAHPQGSRSRPRRRRRAARGGHRGFRPHAEVPPQEPGRAQALPSRWPRSCEQACRKCRSTSAMWGSRSPPSSWSATVSTTPSTTATSPTSRPLRPEAYGGE